MQEPTPLLRQLIADLSYILSGTNSGERASHFLLQDSPQWTQRPIRVMEVGCGQGRDLLALASTAMAAELALSGLDISSTSLEQVRNLSARQRTPISLFPLDVKAPLPFADGNFEILFSHYVLSCDFQSSELTRTFDELHRILTPGGLLYLAVRSTADPTYLKGRQQGAGYMSLGDTGLYFFSQKRLRQFTIKFQVRHELPTMRILDDELYGAIEMILQKPYS